MAMMKNPEQITQAYLTVVVMPQGEIICAGKTIGWVNSDLGIYLHHLKDGITGEDIPDDNPNDVAADRAKTKAQQ